ncbi:unnamed protein product [Pylaiella littoralis]
MSQLPFLLAIFAVGFPPLESFVLSPTSTSTADWLNQQRRPSNSSPLLSTVYSTGSSSSCCREERKFPRTAAAPSPPLRALRATASDKTEENLSQQQQRQPQQSVVRRKTKRPRKHVPVDDVGGEMSSEGTGGADGGLAGDPLLNLVSPVEYADLDFSASAADSSSVADQSSLSSSSASSSSSLLLESESASLPEPSLKDRKRFERIMEDVLAQEKEEELPAVLTKHIEFLLSVDVTSLTNDLIRQEPTMDRVNTLRNAYEFIVTFLESMVESTVDVQKENQTVLRLIIEAAKIGPDVFDKRMQKLQDRFTFEFVKYLDAEVERLEKVEKDLAEQKKNRKTADVNDPPIGGNEVLNVIRIVRTRVCAQVDLMMGEDVAVLTRMLSYDDRFMMRAALRTVLRDKTPKEIAAFGMLVSSTLKDVVELGSGVDPVLRSKLTDMADDIAAVGRDVEERQKDKIEREQDDDA